MNEEYKTFEELKEELGDKFEEYMYGANINLLNNWNELKKWLKEEENYKNEETWVNIQEVLDKMQEMEGNNE